MATFLKASLSSFIFGQGLIWSGLLTMLSSVDRRIGSASAVNIPPARSDQDTSHDVIGRIFVLYCSVLATSSLIIYGSVKSGYVILAPRQPSSYGWFAFDGNVVGGILQGIGMAMVKSEPGVIFVMAGMGSRYATWILLGGVMGGFCFVILNHRLKKQFWIAEIQDRKSKGFEAVKQATSGSWVRSGLVCFGLTSCILLALRYGSFSSATVLESVCGGFIIGLSQLTSILLTKGTLGVSSFYPAFATHLLRLLDKTRQSPGWNSLFFAAGVVLSSIISRVRLAGSFYALDPDYHASTAFIAGTMIIFGARIASGCTSGHGISGCGLFSMSSYITLIMMVIGMVMFSFAKLLSETGIPFL